MHYRIPYILCISYAAFFVAGAIAFLVVTP